MASIQTYNIVLVGSGLPVSEVTAQDFAFLDRPLKEQVRLPLICDLQAGEFHVQLLEERAQFSVEAAPFSDDRINALIGNARFFLDEYAGKRSIKAVGHNFRLALGDDVSPEQVLNDLLSLDRLASSLDVALEPRAGLEFAFADPPATRVLARLGVEGPEPEVTLTANYHCDLKAAALLSEEAVDNFRMSITKFQSLFTKICSLVAGIQA